MELVDVVERIDFDMAISALQTQIDLLKVRMTTAEADITTLKTQTAALPQNVKDALKTLGTFIQTL